MDTGDEDAGAVDEPQASEPVKDAAGKRDADGADLSDDELADVAAEMLGEIVRLMGFEAAVVASWQEDDDNDGSTYLLLDIEGEDLGALIGRRGETLANLQYLVRLMVNQRIKQWRNIVVDVEKYKERREAQLNQLALRMADQVADSGRAAGAGANARQRAASRSHRPARSPPCLHAEFGRGRPPQGEHRSQGHCFRLIAPAVTHVRLQSRQQTCPARVGGAVLFGSTGAAIGRTRARHPAGSR